MKIDFKKYFLTKLKIVSFVLALFGWLLLFIFVFGQFFEQQLLSLTKVFESNIFIWGLRIFIISLIIFLIKYKQFVQKIIENKKVKLTLQIIFIGGATGWILWFITLLF
ncbi:hypothetical protein HOK51_00845 [Candidatus Woesearchaeota archaeon]|jgi:hypothetical protein|nr:hypothetical protein [Candidatus Woesearchaeota archaeon]MBT6518362.1 hypothetical protein [Candidatus Woesearchaeota archaeon]MBT7367288.1 hypothetical protein [Candidatus Woesearchaeota archaeon]